MKMSDALRAAAETAPVDEAHVSVTSVRSRARRNRAIRVGANGIVGVGAAVLVFAGVAGVIANQTGVIKAEDETGGRDVATSGDAPAAPGFAGDNGIVAGGAVDPACGSAEGFQMFDVGDVTATADLASVDDGVAQFTLTYKTWDTDDASYAVGSPVAYVMWGDVVVATGDTSHDDQLLTVAANQPATLGAGFDLNNCWDGAALPAGGYRLVTVTAMDPSVAAGATTDIAPAPVSYAVSEAVPFTIPGDVVDNPFDQYLKGTDPAQPAPNQPSNALTADEARKAYEAALLTGKWDMAAGTQRVVKTGDNRDDTPTAWADSYYGCPSDGGATQFPKESASLDWLDVSAKLPRSIHVSYGWVVDGNPVIHYGVTNDTSWSLPGFWQGTAPRLVLVKDGKVVAEAYPVDPNQNGGGIAYATDAAKAAGESLIYDPSNGYLAPGATLGGDYLWRDINGCWNASRANTVQAGTYTVLSAQDIYVGGGTATAYGTDDAARETLGDGSAEIAPTAVASSAQPEPIMAPAPNQDDYVSFTVWTSLGNVSVTN